MTLGLGTSHYPRQQLWAMGLSHSLPESYVSRGKVQEKFQDWLYFGQKNLPVWAPECCETLCHIFRVLLPSWPKSFQFSFIHSTPTACSFPTRWRENNTVRKWTSKCAVSELLRQQPGCFIRPTFLGRTPTPPMPTRFLPQSIASPSRGVVKFCWSLLFLSQCLRPLPDRHHFALHFLQALIISELEVSVLQKLFPQNQEKPEAPQVNP